MIFSHVLYQLSYLGSRKAGEGPVRATRPLTLAIPAVHPTGEIVLLDRRAGNAVAIAEPFEQVAVPAPARTEGSKVGSARIAAQGASLVSGFRLSRHGRQKW